MFICASFGEGNGNPLQYSCLENPMEGGAWWAAIYGVTQNQTPLKWLSSSSSCVSLDIQWLHSLLFQWYFGIPKENPGEMWFSIIQWPCVLVYVWESPQILHVVLNLIWRRKWQPTPLFLPGEFHGQRSLVAKIHGVTKSRTWLSD